MTSIEEALRSGAVRLVPVRATDEMMDAADRVRALPSLYVEEVYTAMLSASPDHTPALLALIEERDRLKVERDGAVNDRRLSYNLQEHAIRQRDAAIGEREEAWQTVLECQGHTDSWRDRALAAEAKCDALREALEPFAGCIFNDNGDITVNFRAFTTDELIAAYFAHKRARALTQETADVGE